jgi:hypothetical protein
MGHIPALRKPIRAAPISPRNAWFAGANGTAGPVTAGQRIATAPSLQTGTPAVFAPSCPGSSKHPEAHRIERLAAGAVKVLMRRVIEAQLVFPARLEFLGQHTGPVVFARGGFLARRNGRKLLASANSDCIDRISFLPKTF